MTNKNNFDDGYLVDQPDMGCYYYPNMFRFPDEIPEEEDVRAQPMPASMSGHSAHSAQVPSAASPVPSGSPMGMQDMQGGMQGMQMEPTLTDIGYTQAYLKTLIGRRVRVSFLIGTNLLVDRVGTLLQVGISYIVLKQLDANINTMADLYSIKFVDIYNAS